MKIHRCNEVVWSIVAVVFVAIMGAMSPIAHAQPTVIDFEGLCSNPINAPLDTGTNLVTLKVGNTGVTFAVDGYAVTVGAPREAFQNNQTVGCMNPPCEDTPYISDGVPYTAGGKCFYSDDVAGFDNGFNYYIIFEKPVLNLSLDIYDFGDDTQLTPANEKCPDPVSGPYNCKPGVYGTLTVYSDLDQLNEVGSDTWVQPQTYVDGQQAWLAVDSPAGLIRSAVVTFTNPSCLTCVDRGTGIDNITFETALPEINIKPYSWPNAVNSCSSGGTPVIIWGSEYFDVNQIDLESITFGDKGVKVVGKGNKALATIGDFGQSTDDPTCLYVDGCDGIDETPDGYDDLSIKFDTYALSVISEDGEPTKGRVCFDYGSTAVNICVEQEIFLTQDCSSE